ncbi:hypothetical protein LX36DRAFT_654573 [Colletotrichum falcatum]|nr:hypothetical protein LX36DRAFT_654573 [Colletotrichum falcatum]
MAPNPVMASNLVLCTWPAMLSSQVCAIDCTRVGRVVSIGETACMTKPMSPEPPGPSSRLAALGLARTRSCGILLLEPSTTHRTSKLLISSVGRCRLPQDLSIDFASTPVRGGWAAKARGVRKTRRRKKENSEKENGKGSRPGSARPLSDQHTPTSPHLASPSPCEPPHRACAESEI